MALARGYAIARHQLALVCCFFFIYLWHNGRFHPRLPACLLPVLCLWFHVFCIHMLMPGVSSESTGEISCKQNNSLSLIKI